MKSVKVLSKVDLGTPDDRIYDMPTQKPQRRSIDDYTSKLILRSLERKDSQDIEFRLGQHSSVKKFRTKPLHIGRLALTVVGTAQVHTQCFTERKPEKKQNKVILLRNTLSIFSQRLSQNMEIAQECGQLEDPFLLAYCCKIKRLHCSPRNKNIFLLLPSDFLLDQSNFWREEQPEDSGIRVWRQLVNVANVVWLVKKERTLQKLVDYCERMILPLDAVYLLQPKRNKMTLVVNLRPMKEDLQLTNSQKVIFFGLIKQCQTLDSFRILQNKLPLLQHKFIYAHIMNIKTTAAASFFHVLDVLRKQPIQRLDLSPIWQEYIKYAKTSEEIRERRNFSSLSKRYPKSSDIGQIKIQQEIESLDRIETLKKDWTAWIMKMKALSMKPMSIDGDSVPFIVGDMLKRNYPLLDKFYRRQSSPRRRSRNISSQHKQIRSSPSKQSQQIKIQYKIPVFIWNF